MGSPNAREVFGARIARRLIAMRKDKQEAVRWARPGKSAASLP
jgi:hypothetical protein